jgi:hypothetical protein
MRVDQYEGEICRQMSLFRESHILPLEYEHNEKGVLYQVGRGSNAGPHCAAKRWMARPGRLSPNQLPT